MAVESVERKTGKRTLTNLRLKLRKSRFLTRRYERKLDPYTAFV
jgi:hypothetical protein